MPKTYGLNKSKHFHQSYYTDCLMGDDHTGYIITAEKDGDKWIVYCEDHEPSDLQSIWPDEYPVDGFNTLKDAATFIWEFVDYYYGLWEDNNKDDKSTDDNEETTMLTYKMILDEYRNYLKSVMARPEYIYAIDPNGNIGAQWNLGNSKSIYSLELDELIANASDGWMLTLSVKQDPFYIGN